MRFPLFLAVALAAATAPVAAQAEPYTLLIYETPGDLALRDDRGEAGRAYWADYAAYGDMLAQSGAMRGGAALTAPERPSGLTLGGYFTVDVANRAAAEALAAKAPALRRGGRIDVRANMPTMALAR